MELTQAMVKLTESNRPAPSWLMTAAPIPASWTITRAPIRTSTTSTLPITRFIRSRSPTMDLIRDPIDVSELSNFKFANNGSGHLDIGPDGAHTAHFQADVDQSDSFKFANNDSAHPGTVVPHDSPTLTTLPSDSSGTHGPAAPNLNVPGTAVMRDAASDQFVFEKGHDKVADVKSDMIETDHAAADIRHLLHTAHHKI